MFEEFEGYEVVGGSIDDVKSAIATKLMEGYDEMVMEADDPREIMVSKDEAMKLAHQAADRAINMGVAAGILKFEILNQALGNEPAPWFMAMMEADPSDYPEVIAQLEAGDCDCSDCSNDDD